MIYKAMDIYLLMESAGFKAQPWLKLLKIYQLGKKIKYVAYKLGFKVQKGFLLSASWKLKRIH